MMLNSIVKHVSTCVLKCHKGIGACVIPLALRRYSRFEPNDIKYEPDIPEYEVLNIQMKGYDFVVLESFMKYVENLTSSLGIKCNAYAAPRKTMNIKTFKPFSTNILNEYDLAQYDRNVQVKDLPSTYASVLFEAIQQNTPEGIDVSVKRPDPEEDDFRYVPDLVLRELKSQLEEIDRAREERKKK